MPVTNFIWDVVSDNVLSEVDENGTEIVRYSHEPGQFGKLISQRRDSVNSFHHYDAQGNTRQLTDETETVTDTYTYTAFGETVSKSGTTTNPFRYIGARGYYTDSETSEIYVRRRSHSPSIARWMSVDPMMFVDGPNNYVYVGNDPTNKIDPSGMIKKKDDIVNVRTKCCKEYSFADWEWELEHPDSTTGYIIQKISTICNKVPCSELDCDCESCPSFQTLSDKLDAILNAQGMVVFYEAFPVTGAMSDEWTAFAVDDYCGVRLMLGEARYFPTITEQQLKDLGWEVGRFYGDEHCWNRAGGLLATGVHPQFWIESSPGINEPDEVTFTYLEYNCCDQCDERFVRWWDVRRDC